MTSLEEEFEEATKYRLRQEDIDASIALVGVETPNRAPSTSPRLLPTASEISHAVSATTIRSSTMTPMDPAPAGAVRSPHRR